MLTGASRPSKAATWAKSWPLSSEAPPGVEPPLPHRGGKGRGFPKLQGVGGLDVVVAVDQDGGGAL